MVIFIMFIVISLLFTVSLCYTPLTLGFLILSLSLSISIILYLVFSSWLSICSILIYIGGLLVMFSYFIAMNPNLKFDLKKIFFGMLLSFFMLIMIYFVSFEQYYSSLGFSFMNISSVISLKMTPVVVFLIMSLFLALIAVVKITSIKSGPLRPFIYV